MLHFEVELEVAYEPSSRLHYLITLFTLFTRFCFFFYLVCNFSTWYVICKVLLFFFFHMLSSFHMLLYINCFSTWYVRLLLEITYQVEKKTKSGNVNNVM